ncbi:exo-alpha-sialidase [Trypanosoma cruzi]|nr:exo-alpha-sialidase [Trypanosoma cruzi]
MHARTGLWLRRPSRGGRAGDRNVFFRRAAGVNVAACRQVGIGNVEGAWESADYFPSCSLMCRSFYHAVDPLMGFIRLCDVVCAGCGAGALEETTVKRLVEARGCCEGRFCSFAPRWLFRVGVALCELTREERLTRRGSCCL